VVVITEPRGTMNTPTTRAAIALATGAAALLLTACAGSSSGVSTLPAASASSSTTAPATGPTDLRVVAGDGSGTSTSWRLTCDPAGGDHPAVAAACAALAAGGATALQAVPKDQICTQVYGGPQTATVNGTWRGQKVSASFNRTNGCEIARWEALAALLPSKAS
jgi:hypothetical protein